jgi:hypothetical protein
VAVVAIADDVRARFDRTTAWACDRRGFVTCTCGMTNSRAPRSTLDLANKYSPRYGSVTDRQLRGQLQASRI